MTDQELDAEVERLRERGEESKQAQVERWKRMSPAEQGAVRKERGRAAAERLRAQRQQR